MAPKETLLAKLGGADALEAAVAIFYDKVLADDRLKEFFVGKTAESLRLHQVRFMTKAFTEIPEGYDVRSVIFKSHARLFDMGLNEKHFDMVVGHFVSTLIELKIPNEVIDEAGAVLGPLRPIFEQGAADSEAKVKATLAASARKTYFDLAGTAVAISLVVVWAILLRNYR